jgi:hypothetical protein
MSHPRDHHFVPVFYLQQWANQDGKLIEYSRPYRNKIVAKAVGQKPPASGGTFTRSSTFLPNSLNISKISSSSG